MSLSVGQHLGRYQIEAAIGAGGMGEVYRARDTRLQRTVAIKILGLHLAGRPELRERFEREARVISSLNHPHICVLHDVGEENGVDYIVMEYLQGKTLATRLEKGALPLAQALDFAIQIADALDRAHRQSITHRDLKPSNVIVTKTGAKLLDFGLAKLRSEIIAPVGSIHATDTKPMTATVAGTVIGTLPYMPPEQLEGKDTDARSDLFSFGCVLYEMVTGKRAFDGSTHATVIASILDREPPSVQTFDATIPPLLDHIIRRCLAKDPEERWQTAADLKLDLIWLQRHEFANAMRPRPLPAGLARRVRTPFLVALGLVAMAGAALTVKPFTTANDPIRSVAVVPFRNVGTEVNAAYLSDMLTENIINGLSELPNLAVAAWPAVARYKGTDDPDLDKLRRELKVGAAVTGRLEQRGDELSIVVELTDLNANRHLWGHQYRIKRDALPTVPDDIATEITQSLRVTLDETEKNRFEAARLYLKGRYYLERRESDDLKRAISLFSEALGKDPKSARTYAALANSYSLQAIYDTLPPKQRYTQAKVNAEKALELDETVAEAHTALGLVKRDYDQDWAGAEREFRRALELDPNYATAHQWYGEYLTCLGRFDDALAELRQAQRLAPSSLIINAVLGWGLYNAHRTVEAIQQLERTTRMDSGFAVAHWFLGYAYMQHGQLKEALAELDLSTKLGPTNLRSAADRAYVLAVLGRSAEARAVLTGLTQTGPGAPSVSQFAVAVVRTALGEPNEAIGALEKAYAERPWDLVAVKVDPMLDRIRGDARFMDIVRRMRFPEVPTP